MKNNIISKIKNLDYDFSKNFLKHLIFPAVAVILAVVFMFCFNFNLGIDFNGGTVATVVFEQDLNEDNNYATLKSDINEVLNEHKVSVKSYEIVKTNYYGNAISVKFNKVSQDKVSEIKADLIEKFYSSVTDEYELNILVKVNTFSANVDNGVLLSALLAVMVAVIAVAIYIGARYGLCAGFVSGMVALFDCVLTLAWTCILRVEIAMGIVASIAFTAIYSMISSLIYFAKVKDNLKKEIYAKTQNCDIANITLKQTTKSQFILASVILIMVLLVGVVPSTMVRGSSLPALIGIMVALYSKIMLVPGVWATFFIRKAKKAKTKEEVDDQIVVVEEEMVNDKDIDGPEVIVETEAKED